MPYAQCSMPYSNAYLIPHTYRAAEQQSSGAEENPPLNSPFTKGDELNIYVGEIFFREA